MSDSMYSDTSQQTLIAAQQISRGEGSPHDSAVKHVTGRAVYVDDQPSQRGTLYAYPGLSPTTRGKLVALDLEAVRNAPGVVAVVTADDIPGHRDIGPVFPGDPLLAEDEVLFHGQVVFAVAATSQMAARRAARLAKMEFEPLHVQLDVDAALADNYLVRPSHSQTRGDVETALSQSECQLEGTFSNGAQEQMYLEGQAALAIPQEGGGMLCHASTQHPSEGQKLVAEVLGIPQNRVTVEVRRMGGAFGGKETNANQWLCLAALLAQKTGRAVKLRLSRAEDFICTGKRHPFTSHYRVGFDREGQITALDLDLLGNCGISPDLSDAIVDRAMFHADNAYYLPHADIRGHRVRTDAVSHTAFRGFGGPQGMLAIENIIEQIATATGRDPLTIRKLNLYSEAGGRDTTHYGQKIEQHIIGTIIERLEASSDYGSRRKAITSFNASSPVLKRGIALTPVKFGISFTVQHLNQAGALIHIYTDGTVQLNHGGTEMGQGLYTKVLQVVADELGIEPDAIACTATRTDKVPNTSPTAASSGSDLNGMAAHDAAHTLRQRLTTFAAEHFGASPKHIAFHRGRVQVGEETLSFAELVALAYRHRVQLSATGFYRTPKIHYDRTTGTGRPFFYYAYGAAVSEVLIDTLTGEYRLLRTDICQDVGQSINPALDIGQVEGGFVQGMGWLTMEELVWNDDGRLMTTGPASYKIPAIGDAPPDFRVELLPDSPNTEATIFHSKAVGEPPLMLGISVWAAIRDAIGSLADHNISPPLDAPATPERVLAACQHVMAAKGEAL